MAKFTIHYRVLYLPQNTGLQRSEDYWQAHHFTRAVKTGTLKANSSFMMEGKTINKANAHLCREKFGRWLASIASPTGANATIIPVPSKDALVGATSPRSLTMANACCAAHKQLSVLDAIRFTTCIERASSQDGTRDPRILYDAMEVVASPSFKHAILLDDVFTTGAHIRAAKRRLGEAGFKIAYAAVCSWTVHSTERCATDAGSQTIDDAF